MEEIGDVFVRPKGGWVRWHIVFLGGRVSNFESHKIHSRTPERTPGLKAADGPIFFSVKSVVAAGAEFCSAFSEDEPNRG